MAKKSAAQKKNDRKQGAIDAFLRYEEIFNLSERVHIPVMCLDVSSTHTGVMMMSAKINDDDNELADLVPINPDVNTWDKTQTIITPEKVPYGLYPHVYSKIIDFKIKLEEILSLSESLFMLKHGIDPSVFYNSNNPYPKFLAVEAVFLFQKTAIINLTRFQNTAITMLMDRGYIPFEYDNQEAKALIGAVGKKEFVTPLINDMYCIDIPETDKYSHVGDAIALGYLHNYIMRKAIRERQEESVKKCM